MDFLQFKAYIKRCVRKINENCHCHWEITSIKENSLTLQGTREGDTTSYVYTIKDILPDMCILYIYDGNGHPWVVVKGSDPMYRIRDALFVVAFLPVVSGKEKS